MPDASAAEDDDAFEKAVERAVTLYHVTDAGGSLQVTPVATKPLRQDMLNTLVRTRITLFHVSLVVFT